MVQISLNKKKNQLNVTGSMNNLEYRTLINSWESNPRKDIQSFREMNNFSYSSGDVEFKYCDNCVVLSDFEFNFINNVQDKLILASKGMIQIIPLSNLEDAIKIAENHLDGRTISYSIPKSVVLREDLVDKDFGVLKKEISSKYRVMPKEIKPLVGGRTKFGIYYIKIDSGEEFVLKYQGKKTNQAEVIAKISNAYPDIFSRVIKRCDTENFTFKLEDGLYGLEEFVNGEKNIGTKPEFYREMGILIKKLHDNLEEFTRENPSSIKHLSTESRHLSESNLLAIWLDLKNHYRNYDRELRVIKDLINEDVCNRVQSLPGKVIHGDLNHSNILWKGQKPKIIDKETIKISKRVIELQIPLLFTGPTDFPEYCLRSLEYLKEGLDLEGDPLNKEELSLIGPLLKYCLIKNYAVRNIRRALDQEDRMISLKRNLKRIENEFK